MALLTRASVLKARRQFWQTVAVCAAAILLVHLVPKGYCPGDPWRLFYTVVFFAAALVLCRQMLGPRRGYLQQLYAWRYDDAPKPILQAAQDYLYSLDQVITPLAYLVAAFTAATAFAALSCWFPRLSGLSLPFTLTWWFSIIGICLYPLAGGFLLNELAQRYRLLHEQVADGRSYQVRQLATSADIEHDASSLEVRDGQAFRAGGLVWQWKDLTSNCVVFGMTGTGKTICVLNALLEGVLAAADRDRQRPSGLILDPKGDFCGKIRSLCQRYGRGSDLLVIDPHARTETICWNPFDTDDDELELSGRFAAVLESLGMDSGDNSFWIDSARRFLRHAIALVRLTNPASVPPCFADILALAGSNRAVAARTDRLDVTQPQCETCLAFFQEWLEMAPNQRSGIQSHVINMIDPFLLEPYATVFSGRSTVRMADVVREGKILYVHMPLADKEEMARIVGTFIKLEYNREILKSLNKQRPSFFLCDEFQQFFTGDSRRSDADFFERSRQSNHANIIATQNIPGLLRKSSRRESVTNLLGNCATKVFLRNADDETNEFASKLFGEDIMAMGGATGASGSRGIGARVMSSSDQFVRRVSPDTFKDLAVPSREAKCDYCETLAFLGSRSDETRNSRKLKWRIHKI